MPADLLISANSTTLVAGARAGTDVKSSQIREIRLDHFHTIFPHKNVILSN